MQFMIRKRHQPPAVIIVALIDVLIVVLIFLMVTTTMKKPQPSLRLALPESSHANKAGASENPPFVIIIDENGIIRYGTDARAATVDSLRDVLKSEVEKNPQLKVALSADKKAPWGQIVRVMDATKDAKIKSIDSFTKPSGSP